MTELYGNTATLRTADLQTLVKALQDQSTRSVDLVAPAHSFRSSDGAVEVLSAPAIVDEGGVTDPNGSYLLTRSAEADLSARLGIGVKYMRRMHDNGDKGRALYDRNVNHWLAEDPDAKFLLRLLTSDGGHGVCRAILSDRYGIIDNLDVALAALSGLREAGADIGPDDIHADLTENGMQLRVTSSHIHALAPEFLKNYRSPFDQGQERAGNGWTMERARAAARAEGLGYEPGTEPIVFAGFVVTNSETGDGRYSITPQIVVEACRNGLRITADAMTRTHLGARLDEGIVKASADTQRKNLALIAAQTRDAVKKFLSVEYVEQKIRELEKVSGAPVKDVPATIKAVAKAHTFTDDQAQDILSHFIMGGQLTAGGVAQAITSVAQTVADGDTAAGMESAAIPAMQLAASLG